MGGVLICFADFLVLRVLMNRMRLVANDACPAVAWLCFVHGDDRNRCVVDGWGMWMGRVMWMQYGGAIYSSSSTVTLYSCTLSDNTATASVSSLARLGRGVMAHCAFMPCAVFFIT